MSEPSGAAVRFPPPFVPLIALALGMLIHWVAPLPGVLANGPRFGGGSVLVGIGTVVMSLAMGWFRRTGQDPKPWKESPELIVEGIYRRTRNPMYLGMGLVQAGVGLLFGSLWPLLLVPLTWWCVFRIAIRHEEAYLAQKFGEAYERYRASVRRWI